MAAIKKKPTGKVYSMSAPARVKDALRFKCDWKIPNSLTDSKNEARAENIEIRWQLGIGQGDKNPEVTKTGNTSFTSHTLMLNSNWRIGNKTWNRQSFYPLTSVKLYNVHAWVKAKNSKGSGPTVYTGKAMEFPREPTISAPTQAAGSGHVSCTVKANKDNTGVKESYRVRYRILVLDSRWANGKPKVVANNYSTSAEFHLAYDVQDGDTLAYGQYIKVTFEATAQGWRGDSKTVTRSLIVGYPNAATIKSVDAKSKESTTKVTVRISTNKTATLPVTGVKLQAAQGNYYNASDIPERAWSDTPAEDDGECTALSVPTGTLVPENYGEASWVRIKSWNQLEDRFQRFSAPWRIKSLETPEQPAIESDIQLLDIEPGVDGTSAIVDVAWNKSGTDDFTKTELSWSVDENAWRSTEPPETYEFQWNDGASGTWRSHALVHIRGLEEGTTYYVKARRVKEGDNILYSEYSNTLSTTPTTTPTSVVLSAPAFVPRGDSLALSWTHNATSMQTAWEVLSGNGVVANGTDALGGCVIEPDRVETYAQDGVLTLSVRISTGGDYVQSADVEVRVADIPTLELDVADTLTVQPMTFGATVSSPSNLSMTITADGAQGEWPDGMHSQVEGDTVYSDVITPAWDENLEATITLPEGLDFWDGAKYYLTVTAIDNETGLLSLTQTVQFEVAWAHQAPKPPDTITVTPIDDVDADGNRLLQATIQLAAPTGAGQGDLYNVYRYTPDGGYLIAENVGLDVLVTDHYAPFGSGEYGYYVASVTPDGDMDWTFYDYELPCKVVRLDFGTRYAELPWNLSVDDGYNKDFESRAHLGETVPQGYWNETIERTGSFAADLIRAESDEDLAVLRDLGRHSGPVFVRTPIGTAFQANVDIQMDAAHNDALIGIKLDANEVALTGDFMGDYPRPEAGPEEES